MSKKVNKVVRVNLSGGLIGLVFTDPRGAIEKHLNKANADGWNLVQLETAGDANLLVFLLKLAILVLTLGLWTFGTAYYVLFEKDA
jgi:hypothetical protein